MLRTARSRISPHKSGKTRQSRSQQLNGHDSTWLDARKRVEHETSK